MNIASKNIFNLAKFRQSNVIRFSHNINNQQKYFQAQVQKHVYKKYETLLIQDQQPEYKVSKLSNGVHIFTEKQVFPSYIDLGVLINLGIKNEDSTTSGCMALIQNNYLKTKQDPVGVKILEQLHHAGTQILFSTDQESTYIKAQCFETNMDQILDLLLKVSIEQRDFLTDDVNDFQKIPDDQDFYLTQDILFQTAFGLQGIGLPQFGLKETRKNINNSILNKFLEENVTADNIYICAAGISDHQKFVDLVEKQLQNIKLREKRASPPQVQKYKGGIQLVNNQMPMMDVAIAYESLPWNHKSSHILNIVSTVVGNSQSFSSGGPGKGMHARATKNLLNKYYFVDSAQSLNYLFRDTGLFGLQISGPADQGRDLIQACKLELNKLRQFKIDEVELTRAKNILKSQINMVLERKSDRLEESIKNIAIYGHNRIHEYEDMINKVTAEQIQELMQQILSKEPTFVAVGDKIEKLPNKNVLQQMLMH